MNIANLPRPLPPSCSICTRTFSRDYDPMTLDSEPLCDSCIEPITLEAMENFVTAIRKPDVVSQ